MSGGRPPAGATLAGAYGAGEEVSSSSYRWTVLGIIMMGTFMAILDSSIVNVALPHMMSAFGVTRDKIEWVSTAFMIATAVAMPLVGWMVGKVGYKALYLGSLTVFTIGSAGCAFAWSYDALIVARIMQALGGGAIQPVGMAIIADLFAPQERGKALGIWGTGIMIAPAVGPTLGGYLTDWLNWRSIFWVNLPLGVLTLLVGMIIMRAKTFHRPPARPLDIWGFVFLSIALIAGLVALSNGQEKGWDSTYIRTCIALAATGIVLFLGVEASVEHPLLPLRLFRQHNYSLAMLLAIFRAVGLFGGVFLLPLFLENLVGYTTIQTGLRMIPAAVAVGITMPIAGRLSDRYSPRGLVFFGTLVTAVSLFMYGELAPDSTLWQISYPQLLRGAGLALMMTPLMAAALNAVPREATATASSFLNIAQNVGGAFGIAVLNSYVTHTTHVHAVRLGELLPAQSQEYFRFALRSHELSFPGLTGTLATSQFKGMTAAMQAIMHKAQVLGFDNGFMMAGVILLLGLPLTLLLRPSKHHVAMRGAPVE